MIVSIPDGSRAAWRRATGVLLLVIPMALLFFGCRSESPPSSATDGEAGPPPTASQHAPASTADSVERGLLLPATFVSVDALSSRDSGAGKGAGTLTLRLMPDGTFRLRDRRADTTMYELGRWQEVIGDRRLRLQGPTVEAVRVDRLSEDSLQVRGREKDGLFSRRNGSVTLVHEPASGDSVPGPMRLQGMYMYYADAGRFVESRTGRDLRVVQEADNAALERAYLENADPPNTILARVDGRLETRPRIDGAGKEPVLVVDRFREVDPDATCSGIGVVDPVASVEGVQWDLVQVGDRLLPAGHAQANIRFQPADSSVVGSGGCNRLRAGYRTGAGNQITFVQPLTTKRMCPPPVMRVEETLVAALDSATGYRLTRSSLELRRGFDRIVRFQATER